MSVAMLTASPAVNKIIEKYDVQGPRYTSYPPANRFSELTSPNNYQQYLQQRATTVGPLSIYTHIPFCRDICYYCACNKVVTRKAGAASTYIDDLEKEVELKSRYFSGARQVSQLHLGGGTPTYLDRAELTRLMHILATHFELVDSEDREYAIEIDPRTVSPETLALLTGLGFNRISMGIQDFNAEVQQAINRIQDYDMVAYLVESVRQHGFKSLNFDLIYGLPMQSIESMRATVQQVIQLAPDRIAVYNYAHLPERFPTQRQIARYNLPSADTKLMMAQEIRKALLAADYQSIGMDHYAKASDDLALALANGNLQRNFQGYATSLSQETIGLGVSAISTHLDRYVQNVRDLEHYRRLIGQGQLPVERSCELKQEDEIRRFVIMNLACQMRLDFSEVNRRFDINFAGHFRDELKRLKTMEQDGLLDVSDRYIQLTELGRQLIRNICMVFDQYSKADVLQFSRVI